MFLKIVKGCIIVNINNNIDFGLIVWLVCIEDLYDRDIIV